MTEPEILAGLASLDETHPFIKALAAVLADDTSDEVDGVTAPDLTDGARHFNAGRLAHARDLEKAIPQLLQKARAQTVTGEPPPATGV